MRAPDFWYPDLNKVEESHGTMFATLLSPLAFLYSKVGRLKRSFTAPERMSVPVICIGNFTAGGAGKTPTAIAVAQRLIALGETPHFLSRGYGGTETGPVLVNRDVHRSGQVGDEPLLLAAHAPTWVSRDRIAGGHAAEAAGASVIVMDDGFQNPALYKDLSLLVVDTKVGIGNGRVIPAGPLREPIEDALARTDGVIALGAPGHLDFLRDDMPVFNAALMPVDGAPARLRGSKYLAFAGIGRPTKFFDTLTSMGLDVVGTRAFDDHHAYSDADIERLMADADALDAKLITTEKDVVRLQALSAWTSLKNKIEVLAVEATFQHEAALDALLSAGLDKARANYTYAPPGSDQTRTRVR